jgi:hypothetical protein
LSAISTSCFSKQYGEHLQKRDELEARLDELLANAQRLGLPDHATLDTIFAWAAARAYEAGGYPAARTLTLDALEGILLREACRKSAA